MTNIIANGEQVEDPIEENKEVVIFFGTDNLNKSNGDSMFQTPNQRYT